jgi:hypothetical protein
MKLTKTLSSLFFNCCALALLLFISSPVNASEQLLQDLVINTPKGFEPSPRFTGFEQVESFATIKLIEDNQAYTQTTTELLKSSKDIVSRENVMISGHHALLLKTNLTIGGSEFQRQTLLFGDQISTISIVASYPKLLSDPLADNIKQSLLSSRWLRSKQQQIFQGLPFIANPSELLQPVKRSSNSIVFIDKTPYDNSKTVTPLLVLSSVTSEQDIRDIDDFPVQQLKQQDAVQALEIVSQTEFKIDGIRAYQIIARAVDKKTTLPIFIYQAIAMQGKRYLLVQGRASQNQQAQFLGVFKQVTNSIKFRKSAN